jgi:UDP-N-acetylglucosamine 2-epimerase (non-hydrolysing)
VHIAYLIGTRPEAIRSARILEILESDRGVRLTLISSGQHFDWNMLPGFIHELSLPPVTIDLQVGRGSPADHVASILAGLARALRSEPPDAFCVFGDTSSTLAGGLAAVLLEVPLVHIEAGCRSFDMSMPEEINRRLVDHAAGLLLAVSDVGRQNLVREAVPGRIEVVGDPQYDVFAREVEALTPDAAESDERIGLVTLHRPSNVDDRKALFGILEQLDAAARDADLTWVFPVHPRTRRVLQETPNRSIQLTEPLLYRDLLAILARASVCVTDSGGLQKEALWMTVPCVTVRTTTEWLETLWQGTNVLAPPGSDIAATVVESLRVGDRDYSNPYGDGRASERIVRVMKEWLGSGASR